MGQDKRERVRLLGAEIRNLYRIRAAELSFDPEAGLYEITGKNRAGKTSVLRAVMGLVGGAGEVSEDALNDEAEEGRGHVVGRFSNGFRIERRVTKPGTKGRLVVEGPDGGRYGQKTVNGWLQNGAINLGGLIHDRKESEIVDLLLGIGKRPDLKEELGELDDRIAAVKEERTPWHSQKQRAERTGRPDSERPEPLDISGDMARLKELRAQEDKREQLHRDWNARQGDCEQADENVDEQCEIIADLKSQLAEAEAALPEIEAARDKVEAAMDVAEKEWMEAPDPSDEVDEVEARISEADEVVEVLEPWKEWDRAQEEIEEAREEIAASNGRIEQLKGEKRALLDDAQIPVRGLTFSDDGQPLLNGRMLEVASGRERVEFELDVAIAQDNNLRLVLLDEAHGLDKDGMMALRREVEDHDLMALACRIEPSGVGEVVVCDDGKAWNEGREDR